MASLIGLEQWKYKFNQMKNLFTAVCMAALLAPPLAFANPVLETVEILSEEMGQITGRVVSQDGLGIPYASVEIFDDAGELIDGVLTDGDGSFTLSNKVFGSYTLKISVVGQKAIERIVEISQEQQNLGDIILTDDVINLGETTVRGEVSKIRSEIDKRVIEVGKDLVSAGATAGEVLNNIPSLNVDQQSGSLSLRGNSNVRVFVDGKPSSIPADQLLKQLPSNSIEKVEIITNPSAKYEPDGNSGIVNIITTKEKRRGYNVTTNLGYTRGAKNKYNASVNANLNTGNLNLFGNYSANVGESNMNGRMVNKTMGINQYLTLPGENEMHLAKLGFDWFINDKTAMTVYTNQSFGNMDMNNVSYLDYINGGSFRDASDYGYDRNGSDYSMNIKRDFEKEGHSLELDAFYSNFAMDGHTDFEWQTAMQGIEDPTLANQLGYYDQADEKDIKNTRFKLDYTLPFAEKGKIEAGFNYVKDANENGLLTTQHLPVYNEGAYVGNLEAQNTFFDFDRNIAALYLNIGYQWEKLGMQVGVRGEKVTEDILTVLNGSADIDDARSELNRDQTNFYPSVFFTYQATKSDQFSLNYSRRVDRPGVWALSPIRQWQTASMRQEGNPNLKPQFTDSYELGYMKTIGRMGSINASVFYRKVNDEMTQLTYLDEVNPNITIMRRDNVDDNQSYGAEVSWYLKANKWWSLNGGLNLYQSTLKSILADQGTYEVESTDFTGRLSNDFALNKALKLQLFTMYIGDRKTLQGSRDAMFRQDIGLRYSFAQGKGSVSARLSDIFDTFYAKSYMDRPVVQENEFHWESRTFYIGLNYSFGGKVKTRADKQRNQGDHDAGGIGF